MGQVRKDILNGWKEIGGYVGRDIRTVERWEKQRGLPVRRVPGAGRATVYALISELDEWLENSKPDLAENAAESRTISDPVSNPDVAAKPEELKVGAEDLPDLFAAAGKAQTEDESAAGAAEFRPAARDKSEAWFSLGRWRRGDGAIVTAAAILLCLLVVPVGHGHAKSAFDSQKMSSGQRNSVIPYRSQVAGVDDLYLRGIYSYEQRTPESLGRSEEDFSGAIAKDPNYAPAYAALANTYNLLREYSAMPEQEAYPKAKAAAEHAIALDPKLPEAHASLGFIDFFWSWETVKAEQEFRTGDCAGSFVVAGSSLVWVDADARGQIYGSDGATEPGAAAGTDVRCDSEHAGAGAGIERTPHRRGGYAAGTDQRKSGGDFAARDSGDFEQGGAAGHGAFSVRDAGGG